MNRILLISLLVLAPVHAKTLLRVGYFPNVTHAQGIIGKKLSSQPGSWFSQLLGSDVELQWFPYNAGPSAMEALLAGSIDLTYVGPNPVLNTYMRSNGEEGRVLAGAARGGAALLVQSDGRIRTPADFKGRVVATPQLGNTQDVAARIWLRKQGFKITQTGGDVTVLPTANPDQLILFQQNKLDAVWTVEPWVSRLEHEAGAKIFLEQNDAVTTLLVASVLALKEKPKLVRRFAQAHRELTSWLKDHQVEAQAMVRQGLEEDTKRPISQDLIVSAWRRLNFTTNVSLDELRVLVEETRALGFIKGEADLGHLLEKQP